VFVVPVGLLASFVIVFSLRSWLWLLMNILGTCVLGAEVVLLPNAFIAVCYFPPSLNFVVYTDGDLFRDLY
jgi:hypothetical protein